MKNNQRFFTMRNSIGIGGGSLFLIWLTLIAFHPRFDGDARPAWIQAVGSIGAVLAAVWVMAAQHGEKREQDEASKLEREDRFLRSIRTEVDVLLKGFQATTRLGEIPVTVSTISRFYYPPERPFVIFDALAADIVDVIDDGTRRLIIETYSKAKGCLVLLQMNNNQLAERRRLIKAGELTTSQAYQDAEASLLEIATQFWERYKETVPGIDEIRRTFPH